ncbi:MAG: hypothetical protein HY672_02845 [Chloroflexi bacterium]|nr:hypothetical protein [Chloroflexota bacterium]
MASNCVRCGRKLGLLQRFSDDICSSCKVEVRREREAAETEARRGRETALAEYPKLLKRLWSEGVPIEEGRNALNALSRGGQLDEQDKRSLISRAFRTFSNDVLDDDILSADEEKRLLDMASLLGIEQERLETDFRDLLFRLVVARANDGRLPTLPDSKILLKKGEIAHISMQASLMKEVVKTEYHGGYAGVSFRIAKGVRFHTGGFRGKSVVVGTEIRPEDLGVITATSQRVVFTGQRRTVEIPYTKLINLEVFSDGMRFSSSNRKNTVLFKLESGEAMAAVVNAAAQETFA